MKLINRLTKLVKSREFVKHALKRIERKKMKFYSFYLPQFHEIEENNMWWGKGFTEWTNVKKAKPLFVGHNQPQEPLDDNYYDLLDKHTVKWQTDLMKTYGLSGMIYYHYYFCGKKLLEKPAENLLKWKDINQSFFFCWANHSWYRSWEGSKELLMKQEYGSVFDWSQHFDYLLPFFLDSRYEKINNKPVFMIFSTNFKERDEMFTFFDQQCKKNGFDGIFIIETCNTVAECESISTNTNYEKVKFYREPLIGRELYYSSIKYRRMEWYTQFLWKRFCIKVLKRPALLQYDGNKIFEYLLKENRTKDSIAGLFFGWDNSPRHGKRAYIITEPDKEKVMEYLDSVKDSEYVFVNAWNEWAEGMILEPTKKNGFKYLEWIKEWCEKNDCKNN